MESSELTLPEMSMLRFEPSGVRRDPYVRNRLSIQTVVNHEIVGSDPVSREPSPAVERSASDPGTPSVCASGGDTDERKTVASQIELLSGLESPREIEDLEEHEDQTQITRVALLKRGVVGVFLTQMAVSALSPVRRLWHKLSEGWASISTSPLLPLLPALFGLYGMLLGAISWGTPMFAGIVIRFGTLTVATMPGMFRAVVGEVRNLFGAVYSPCLRFFGRVKSALSPSDIRARWAHDIETFSDVLLWHVYLYSSYALSSCYVPLRWIKQRVVYGWIVFGCLYMKCAFVRWCTSVRDRVKGWYAWSKERHVVICGFPVSILTLASVSFVVALVLSIVIYAVKGKKKQEQGKEDQVWRDAFDREMWTREPRRRALLSCATFVTSLVAFGNLKLLREMLPWIQFSGWVQNLLPTESTVANTCIRGPKECRAKYALGTEMCSECAAHIAVRKLESIRFVGSKKFNPRLMLAHLCEDIVTHADLDSVGRPKWFLAHPLIVQKAVLGDVYESFMAGQMRVDCDQNGVVSIKTTLDPMTLCARNNRILFKNAGLLKPEELESADMTDPEKGLGWVASRPTSRAESRSRSRASSVDEKKSGFIPGDLLVTQTSQAPLNTTSVYWKEEFTAMGTAVMMMPSEPVDGQMASSRSVTTHMGPVQFRWRAMAQPGYSGPVRIPKLSKSDPIYITVNEGDEEKTELNDGWIGLDGDEIPVNETTQTDVSSEDYVVWAKDSDFAVYRLVSTGLRGWRLRILTWKNDHPVLSKGVDILLGLIAIFLIYLALSMAYERMKLLFSRWFTMNTGIQLESNVIEDEGAGKKNRYAKRAEGVRDAKIRYEPVGPKPQRDKEYDRSDLDVVVQDKNFFFYNLEDIIKQLEKGGTAGGRGIEMYHPDSPKQRRFARDKATFQKLYSDGWRPLTGNLGVSSVRVPQDVWKSNPDVVRGMQMLQWAYRHPETNLGISEKDFKAVQPYLKAANIGNNSKIGKALTTLVTNRDSEHKPSRRELEDYLEYLSDPSSDASALVEEEENESNVQEMVNNLCPNEQNKKVCKNKNCDRIHVGKKVVDECLHFDNCPKKLKTDLNNLCNSTCGHNCIHWAHCLPHMPDCNDKKSDEAMIGPALLPIDPFCVHKIQYLLNDGTWGVRGATCFSGPLGLYSVRHALIDLASGDYIYPLNRVRVVQTVPSYEGNRVVYREIYHKIDPLSVSSPTSAQLMKPSRINDFIRFRCYDKDFMQYCQDHRVHLGDMSDDISRIRIAAYPGSSSQVVIAEGLVVDVNKNTGEVAYTGINTEKGDSGAPIFNERGRCVGIHKGGGINQTRNFFLACYTGEIVTWFVQSEPKNS